MPPSRLMLCFLLIGVSVCLPVATVARQDDLLSRMNPKQLQAMAKALVDEGKSLERQGKLDEAREKFIDAEGYFSTKDALAGIDRVRDAKTRKSESLLESASAACSGSTAAVCAAQLNDALAVGPEKPAALHNNLAMSYIQLGDREEALSHVDALIVATPDAHERANLAQLHTSLTTGEKPAAIAGDARRKIDAFNASFAQDSGDAKGSGEKATGASSAALCDTVMDIAASVASSPAVLYDAAKCAEEQGDPAVAASDLGRYLQLAPHALDASETALRRDDLLALAGLAGASGDLVRSHFAAAALDLDYRRYDRALEQYQQAQQAAPTFPITYWRLGILCEAEGSTEMARAYLQRYLQLAPNADRKNDAVGHLNSLDSWRAEYNYDVTEAHDLLADLLNGAMGMDTEGVQHGGKKNGKISPRAAQTLAASGTLSAAFVQRQLEEARGDLEEATELFPIAPEANEMLALLDMENNDWRAAFRSFDAVMSAGMPVSFYAQVNSSSEERMVRAAKVEINKRDVRLVYLSSYDAKKRRAEPATRPAGYDGLGNIATSDAVPPDTQAEALTVPATSIGGIATADNFVVLKEPGDQLMLAPVHMVALTPTEGRTAREFGNEYTRMFVRYLGYESARLGKEGMTFGEKIKLGYSFVQTGMSIYETVQTGGMEAQSALKDTMKLIGKLRTDLTNLRRTLSDQRRALDGLEFKAIPTGPVELAYRSHL